MTPKSPQEGAAEPAGGNGHGAGVTAGKVPVPLVDVTAASVNGVRGPVHAVDEHAAPPRNLRRVLVTVDSAAATVGWGLGFLLPLALTRPLSELPLWAAVAGLGPLATLSAMASQRLYRARSCAVWSTEIRHVGRAVALTVAGMLALVLFVEARQALLPLLLTAGLLATMLVLGRAGYRAWLGERRRIGQYTRGLVLVGANEEALDLHRLLEEQAELGFRIRGLVCAPRQGHWAQLLGVPWFGPVEAAEEAVRRVRATGAVVVASAVTPDQLNTLARRLPDAGVHLHLAHGLRGIASHRVQTVPLGSEPLLYVESLTRDRRRMRTKRLMDVAVGGLLLLLSVPVLLGAVLAIKLEDRGPVLFRQLRIGLDGSVFEILKLRTMRVDAEARRSALSSVNARNGSPLFKMADDPRVTRIGRVLRVTSLDELPQLINVLRGQMSLVGPRPALLEEHEAFDSTLKQRDGVLPGITGLWQVEARDNPAFGPYRRLDLYYVDNWSIGLDLAILVATAVGVGGRGLSVLRQSLPGRRKATGAVAGEASAAVLE